MSIDRVSMTDDGSDRLPPVLDIDNLIQEHNSDREALKRVVDMYNALQISKRHARSQSDLSMHASGPKTLPLRRQSKSLERHFSDLELGGRRRSLTDLHGPDLKLSIEKPLIDLQAQRMQSFENKTSPSSFDESTLQSEVIHSLDSMSTEPERNERHGVPYTPENTPVSALRLPDPAPWDQKLTVQISEMSLRENGVALRCVCVEKFDVLLGPSSKHIQDNQLTIVVLVEMLKREGNSGPLRVMQWCIGKTLNDLIFFLSQVHRITAVQTMLGMESLRTERNCMRIASHLNVLLVEALAMVRGYLQGGGDFFVLNTHILSFLHGNVVPLKPPIAIASSVLNPYMHGYILFNKSEESPPKHFFLVFCVLINRHFLQIDKPNGSIVRAFDLTAASIQCESVPPPDDMFNDAWFHFKITCPAFSINTLACASAKDERHFWIAAFNAMRHQNAVKEPEIAQGHQSPDVTENTPASRFTPPNVDDIIATSTPPRKTAPSMSPNVTGLEANMPTDVRRLSGIVPEVNAPFGENKVGPSFLDFKGAHSTLQKPASPQDSPLLETDASNTGLQYLWNLSLLDQPSSPLSSDASHEIHFGDPSSDDKLRRKNRQTFTFPYPPGHSSTRLFELKDDQRIGDPSGNQTESQVLSQDHSNAPSFSIQENYREIERRAPSTNNLDLGHRNHSDQNGQKFFKEATEGDLFQTRQVAQSETSSQEKEKGQAVSSTKQAVQPEAFYQAKQFVQHETSPREVHSRLSSPMSFQTTLSNIAVSEEKSDQEKQVAKDAPVIPSDPSRPHLNIDIPGPTFADLSVLHKDLSHTSAESTKDEDQEGTFQDDGSPSTQEPLSAKTLHTSNAPAPTRDISDMPNTGLESQDLSKRFCDTIVVGSAPPSETSQLTMVTSIDGDGDHPLKSTAKAPALLMRQQSSPHTRASTESAVWQAQASSRATDTLALAIIGSPTRGSSSKTDKAPRMIPARSFQELRAKSLEKTETSAQPQPTMQDEKKETNCESHIQSDVLPRLHSEAEQIDIKSDEALKDETDHSTKAAGESEASSRSTGTQAVSILTLPADFKAGSQAPAFTTAHTFTSTRRVSSYATRPPFKPPPPELRIQTNLPKQPRASGRPVLKSSREPEQSYVRQQDLKNPPLSRSSPTSMQTEKNSTNAAGSGGATSELLAQTISPAQAIVRRYQIHNIAEKDEPMQPAPATKLRRMGSLASLSERKPVKDLFLKKWRASRTQSFAPSLPSDTTDDATVKEKRGRSSAYSSDQSTSPTTLRPSATSPAPYEESGVQGSLRERSTSSRLSLLRNINLSRLSLAKKRNTSFTSIAESGEFTALPSTQSTTSSLRTIKANPISGIRKVLRRKTSAQSVASTRKAPSPSPPEPDVPVFGVELATAVSRCAAPQEPLLPAVVFRSIQYLDRSGLKEEGLYRMSSSVTSVRSYIDELNKGRDFDFSYPPARLEPCNVHTACTLLKAFLRELPEHVLTDRLAPAFTSIADPSLTTTQSLRFSHVEHLVRNLPQPNYVLMRSLMRHLMRVVEQSQHNLMSARNLSLIFSQTLRMQPSLFLLLLSESHALFGHPYGQWNVTSGPDLSRSKSAEQVRQLYRQSAKEPYTGRAHRRNHSVSENPLPLSVRNPDITR